MLMTTKREHTPPVFVPITVTLTVECQAELDALIALTNKNYGLKEAKDIIEAQFPYSGSKIASIKALREFCYVLKDQLSPYSV